MMNKLLVICGPTATGKTSLGVHLAKKFDGEIVSADSRQVYIGMNVGTGKDIKNGKWIMPARQRVRSQAKSGGDNRKSGHWEVEGVPIWMLDVVEPNQEFSVAQYVDLAQKVIKDVLKRGKSRLKVEDPRRRASGLPIIVGGTGFYIKGLIDGIETLGIEPDWELRMRLENLPAQRLFDLLARLDLGKAASMNVSDRKNPRRLARAIELAGKTPESKLDPRPYTLDPLFIGLKAELKELYRRIDRRVEERVKLGVEKEIRKLIKKGYSWNLPAMSAMGYREWQLFFEDKAAKEEAIQKWKFDEHGYARRQLTWFKKDKRINWFDIDKKNWKKRVEDLVKSWYNEDIKN